MINFLYPLFLLLALLPFVYTALRKPSASSHGDALRVPFVADFIKIAEGSGKTTINGGMHKFGRRFWFLYIIWLLLTLAAMRPVEIGEPIRVRSAARDILLVTDISTSMVETDFSAGGQRVSRMQAVQAVVSDFIKRRPEDRFGLVLFGTRAYLQAPLTYDHAAVQDVLWSMTPGMAGNSTAIGDAVGLALKTLKSSGEDLNKKMIVLLTDGENNDGSLSMEQAVELAQNEGVKIYTVSVGGGSYSLLNAMFGVNPLKQSNTALSALANKTGATAFQAENLKALAEVYNEINKLEPSLKDQNFIYPQKELFFIPLLVAFLLSVTAIWWIRRAK